MPAFQSDGVMVCAPVGAFSRISIDRADCLGRARACRGAVVRTKLRRPSKVAADSASDSVLAQAVILPNAQRTTAFILCEWHDGPAASAGPTTNFGLLQMPAFQS